MEHVALDTFVAVHTRMMHEQTKCIIKAITQRHWQLRDGWLHARSGLCTAGCGTISILGTWLAPRPHLPQQMDELVPCAGLVPSQSNLLSLPLLG